MKSKYHTTHGGLDMLLKEHSELLDHQTLFTNYAQHNIQLILIYPSSFGIHPYEA